MVELTLVRDMESSIVDSVEYNERGKFLVVAYNNGGVYVYNQVPQEIFTELLTCASVGSYINRKVVRGGYSYSKL